jgi:hypothetical protein
MNDKEIILYINTLHDKLTVEQLDHALLFYYKTSNSETFNSSMYDSLDEKFNLGLFQKQMIIQKLVKDEYVTERKKDFGYTDPKTKEMVIRKNTSFYQISFYGVLFHEQGGYGGSQNREKERSDFEQSKMKLELRQMDSVIDTNKLTNLNIGVTIAISLLVLIIQVVTCNREARKENLEVRKLERDSLNQLQQAKHDTLYENYLFRKVKVTADSAINARLKK